MSKRSDSTRVQFPRFEYETPSNGPLLNRQLRRRAPLRQWLSEAVLKPLFDPGNIVHSEPAQPQHNGWYGVYHTTGTRVTQIQRFRSPVDGKVHGYRSKLLEHTYLWDQQALDGRSHELVLEREAPTPDSFDEVLAVLIPCATPWRPAPGQRLLVRQMDSQWGEPVYGAVPDHRRDFYLAVATELAVRKALAPLASAQQST